MKSTHYWLLCLGWLLLTGCRRELDAPVPHTFADAPGAGRFTAALRTDMEGVYGVTNGSERFGRQVALKWTYTRTGTDTTHYLSVFTGIDAGLFILEIEPEADGLVLAGYWHQLVNAETGQARFTVRTKRSGRLQSYDNELTPGDTLVLEGHYGESTANPAQTLTLTYQRPLNSRPFSIMAHRGGGRTSDLLPASENSLEMIRLASRLGATGIEIDVRYTKEGVPILYHDNTLNLRLIQKNGLNGPVESYTYKQLSGLVRLINGEKIPTLEEALETVLNQTSLRFVWLDTKFTGSMETLQAIQRKYRQRAALAGRNVDIVIGLPGEEAVSSYRALADKTDTPVLCELDTAITRSVQAHIWAPRWTLGPQTEEVRAMKAEGRTVFVWTLDEPQFIQQFIQQNSFDGILSNYSSVVAYYHYLEP